MLNTLADWMYLSPLVLIYATGTAQVSRFYHPMRHLRRQRVPDWMRYAYTLHGLAIATALMLQLLVKSDWSMAAFTSAFGEWLDIPLIGWIVVATTVLLVLTPLNALYTICYVRGARAEAEFREGFFAYPGV